MRWHVSESVNAVAIGLVRVRQVIFILVVAATFCAGLLLRLVGNRLDGIFEMAFVGNLSLLAVITRPFAIALAVYLAKAFS